MGLDIAYETLHQYLAARFESPKIAERAVNVISEEIRRQTGTGADLAENAPSEQLTPERYGPYSSIHALRLYACRVSGYTLEEAYQIPIRRISFRKTEMALREDDVEDNSDGPPRELTADEEFSEEWGEPVDVVVPRASTRLSPFPYRHLVCFSDSEGIYVPVDFPEPFQVDDIYVGSSVHLSRELQDIGNHLVQSILNTMRNSAAVQEQFLLYVRQLWRALETPCTKSVRARTSMIFT